MVAILMVYRILITGSRTWDDEDTIREAIGAIVAVQGPENVVVVHGACPQGADHIADRIAGSWGGGMTVERHPADWRPNGRLDFGAGYRRNADMVNLGADVCLAFIRDGSKGATHCADLAERAGIELRRWTA